jgi:hypothetical protein
VEGDIATADTACEGDDPEVPMPQAVVSNPQSHLRAPKIDPAEAIA